MGSSLYAFWEARCVGGIELVRRRDSMTAANPQLAAMLLLRQHHKTRRSVSEMPPIYAQHCRSFPFCPGGPNSIRKASPNTCPSRLSAASWRWRGDLFSACPHHLLRQHRQSPYSPSSSCTGASRWRRASSAMHGTFILSVNDVLGALRVMV